MKAKFVRLHDGKRGLDIEGNDPDRGLLIHRSGAILQIGRAFYGFRILSRLRNPEMPETTGLALLLVWKTPPSGKPGRIKARKSRV